MTVCFLLLSQVGLHDLMLLHSTLLLLLAATFAYRHGRPRHPRAIARRAD